MLVKEPPSNSPAAEIPADRTPSSTFCSERLLTERIRMRHFTESCPTPAQVGHSWRTEPTVSLMPLPGLLVGKITLWSSDATFPTTLVWALSCRLPRAIKLFLMSVSCWYKSHTLNDYHYLLLEYYVVIFHGLQYLPDSSTGQLVIKM